MFEKTQVKDDFTFLSSQEQIDASENAVDRAIRQLKIIDKENQEINKKINDLKHSSHLIIEPQREILKNKIKEISEENNSIKKLIQLSKYPGYAEMTKKKVILQDMTPWKRQFQSQSNSFIRRRDNIEDDNSNFEKYQLSTCFNQKQQPQHINDLLTQPNTQTIRQNILAQFQLHMQRYEVFRRELQLITSQRHHHQYPEQYLEVLKSVEQYRNKLMKLLNRLKSRESEVKSLIKTYQKIYAQTIEKFQQAHRNLQILQKMEISTQIDEQYAQVLQLEQRLALINQKLEEFNEDKWLKQILKQLKIAMENVGIQIPKKQNIRQMIDQICSMLIECISIDEKESKEKINLLKEYYQQQNQNHQKALNLLKNKQQTLAKKLLDIQMGKQ